MYITNIYQKFFYKRSNREIRVENYKKGQYFVASIKLVDRTKPPILQLQKKQSTSISANIIQSIDAYALHYVIVNYLEKSNKSFMAMHDSFCTSTADSKKIILFIRKFFKNLFKEKFKSHKIHQIKGYSEIPEFNKAFKDNTILYNFLQDLLYDLIIQNVSKEEIERLQKDLATIYLNLQKKPDFKKMNKKLLFSGTFLNAA